MAVLEAHVRYRQPLVFDDLVDVHVAMGEVTRATFQMTYLLTVDDEIRSTAVTAHGALTTIGRPTRLPDWFRGFASGSEAT
jgi:acyl-CoA thioester hydrolase